MIYFTDGRGIYPAKRPVYETAFVFMEEEYEDVGCPAVGDQDHSGRRAGLLRKC